MLPHAPSDPFTLVSGEGEAAQVDVSVADDLASSVGAQRYDEGPVLGRGGMGEVFAVLDRRIGRRVAKKALLERVDRGPARARFLREARVQGQLEHPSIVPVYDLDADVNGRVYFTMKRVRGNTLERVLDHLRRGDPEFRSRHSQRRLLAALQQVCLAVEYAHARGVVHRDLKPSNVMLGDFGEVYVLDWGLAKWVREVEDDPPGPSLPPPAGGTPSVLPASGAPEPALRDVGSVTVGSGVLGTLAYMAPEQLLQAGRPLDARVDVYALGAILFEIVTESRLRRTSRVDEVISDLMSTDTVRPSQRAPGVPPELDELTARALMLDPERRLATARELADGLQRFLDGDRDLELRRELAARHAASAESALTAPSGGDRVLALRAALSALALDAESPVARRALLACLTAPSDDVPAPARAEWAAELDKARNSGARTAILGLLSWLLALPVVISLGVRSWPLVAATSLWTLVAMLQAWRMSRKSSYGPRDTTLIAALVGVVVAFASCYLGPMVLLPTCATSSAMLLALNATRQEHWRLTLVIAFAASVPFLLELLEIGPIAYTFEPGRMILAARAVDLPRVPTLLAMLYSTVSFIILTAFAMARLRDVLRASQQRLFVQAWLLEQISPKKA